MDWKGLVAIFLACALMGAGVFTGRCSEALSMLCSAIVGGVFGYSRSVPKPLPPPRADYVPNANPSGEVRQ